MKTKKEIFESLVQAKSNSAIVKNSYRTINRSVIRESKNITMRVLERLDELNWSKDDLYKKMNIPMREVNYALTSNENMSLLTLVRLQEVLNIPILSTFKNSNK